MALEIYSVDIKEKDNLIICGGDDNQVDIFNYKEDYPLTKVDDLDESAIFCKFLQNDRFLIVTLAGTIAIMSNTEEIRVIEIGEVVSTVTHKQFDSEQSVLVVGCESGMIYVYNSELDHINTINSHSTEILDCDFRENKVVSLSSNQFFITDEFGRNLVSIHVVESTAFKYIGNHITCLAQRGKVQIFKGSTILFEYSVDGTVDTIEFVEKTFVIGGDFNYILLINTSANYGIFKYNLDLRVNKIKLYRKGLETGQSYEIIFSTYCGFIGKMDIRTLKSLVFYECSVGTIFDFNFGNHYLVVGGLREYNLINLNENKLTLGEIYQIRDNNLSYCTEDDFDEDLVGEN